jgi:uncharacterized protein
VDELFAPPGSAWQRVSPRLALVRHAVVGVAALLGAVLVVVLSLLPDFLPGWFLPVGLVVVLLCAGWGWWWVGRNARRWGYAEGDDELFITRGAMFRTLVVVPYGRMQFVDVQAGPVEQLAGIASVHLHTASPGTSARIPGLPAEEAARLRDRLTAMGESWAAGL